MWLSSQANAWSDKQVGGAGLMKGTPSPANRTKNGDLHVFYVRSDGGLYDVLYNGTTWVDSLVVSGVTVPPASE